MREYVKEQFVNAGMCADFCLYATDWNEQTKAEQWRAAWAKICNRALGQNSHAERIDHRSYARQVNFS